MNKTLLKEFHIIVLNLKLSICKLLHKYCKKIFTADHLQYINTVQEICIDVLPNLQRSKQNGENSSCSAEYVSSGVHVLNGQSFAHVPDLENCLQIVI